MAFERESWAIEEEEEKEEEEEEEGVVVVVVVAAAAAVVGKVIGEAGARGGGKNVHRSACEMLTVGSRSGLNS